jgi:hypothetical protein
MSNSRVFVCINHLVTKIGAIYYFIFLYILIVYYCCWRKINFWIDNRIVRMKFTRDRTDRGLIRFDKGRNLVSQ